MFSLSISDGLLEKLRHMLANEADGTCIRLREYKCGGG